MACMGPRMTADEKAAQKKSREIDELIAKDAKSFRNEVRLLLLGPGESGKSTIFKQMKIIQKGGGYTKEELKNYKYIVFGNCITQMKILVNATLKLQIPLDSEQIAERCKRIALLPPSAEVWNPQVGEDIRELWKAACIQAAFEQRDKLFQLNDSAPYFFDNVNRFIEPDFVPIEQDVLRARVRTTGIDEAVFDFEDISFRMVDVGGQRAERRKWIHCFDSVKAVTFCASLAEYDQVLREDNTMNRMSETLSLFDEICNSPWFRETSLILFLNKTDLFKEKIKKVDLKVCFEKYTGGSDFEAASSFVKSRFLEENQSPHTIYVHFTCAINTENVEFVFRAVRETLMKELFNQIVL